MNIEYEGISDIGYERTINEDFIAIEKIDENILKDRYKIDFNSDDELIDIFEKICKARGFVLRGNNFDYERCARAILDDFKKGRLGKITLDL